MKFTDSAQAAADKRAAFLMRLGVKPESKKAEPVRQSVFTARISPAKFAQGPSPLPPTVTAKKPRAIFSTTSIVTRHRQNEQREAKPKYAPLCWLSMTNGQMDGWWSGGE